MTAWNWQGIFLQGIGNPRRNLAGIKDKLGNKYEKSREK